jgi:hypothetical protein
VAPARALAHKTTHTTTPHPPGDKRLDEWVAAAKLSALPRGGMARLESMPSLGLQA